MKRHIKFISIALATMFTFSGNLVSAYALATSVDSSSNFKYGMGNIDSDMEPTLDRDPDKLSSSSYDLPKSVDLSLSDYFPCIRSQGQIGSCTAWASTYYQFTYEVAKLNSWNAKNDPDKQFSPKWTYNFINEGEDNGSSFQDAYELLSKQGAVRYSEFTPTGIDTESEYRTWYLNKDNMKKALQYRVSEYRYKAFSSQEDETPITSPNSISLLSMKSLLNAGKVLTVQTYGRGLDYQKLKNQYNSTLNNQFVCTKYSYVEPSGHAMTIVGYDDNITYDLNGDGHIQDYEKGAFKLANSWGTSYENGNDGYIWVMYDALNKISNAQNQNVKGRTTIFKYYGYAYINVEEYPLNLIAEVTIDQARRNELRVDLWQSEISKDIPEIYKTTFLNGIGGEYNYSGLSANPERATFVFDYSTLCYSQIQRQKFHVSVHDLGTQYNTFVKSIKLIDKTGKIVVNDNINDTFNNKTKLYSYAIGMVGDVNNDGCIDSRDITDLQNYLSGNIDFTSDDMLVADVNGDGKISVNDVLDIQYYVAGFTDSFANGHFVKLG